MSDKWRKEDRWRECRGAESEFQREEGWRKEKAPTDGDSEGQKEVNERLARDSMDTGSRQRRR